MEGFSHSTHQPPLFPDNCHLFIYFFRRHINDILGSKNPNIFFYLGNRENYSFIFEGKRLIYIVDLRVMRNITA